mmetsp:Transcript_31460/g.57832  ORF Transcript_31460/g.57832 Transcript_31460/m.57832 type:complete len:338 (+) Transcript_31460:63-1076(+)
MHGVRGGLSERLSTCAALLDKSGSPVAARRGLEVIPTTPRQSRPGKDDGTSGVRPMPHAAVLGRGSLSPQAKSALSSRLSQALAQPPASTQKDCNTQRRRSLSESLAGVQHREPARSVNEELQQSSCSRRLAMSQALEQSYCKRSRVGSPMPANTNDQVTCPEESGPERTAYKWNRLEEWMQVASQHEVPARGGRQTRVVRGGLQECYLKAVRDHLTDASLSHQRAPPGCGEHASEPSRADELTVEVARIHSSAQGLLIIAHVDSQPPAWLTRNVRLLVHAKHPLYEQLLSRSISNMFLTLHQWRVVSNHKGHQGRAPLILPLRATLSNSNKNAERL